MTVGILICAVAAARAVTFSAQTGSSNQNGSYSSTIFARRTAFDGTQPPVDLHQHVDIGADRLANRAHAIGGDAQLLHADVAAPPARHRVELEAR